MPDVENKNHDLEQVLTRELKQLTRTPEGQWSLSLEDAEQLHPATKLVILLRAETKEGPRIGDASVYYGIRDSVRQYLDRFRGGVRGYVLTEFDCKTLYAAAKAHRSEWETRRRG